MGEAPTRSWRISGGRQTRSDPPTEAQYSAPLDSGEGFSTRYLDAGKLGRGGMAEVRLCVDRKTERDVAVKRIHRQKRNDRTQTRFLREARIQAQLDHPTVVPVYDIGVDDEGLEYFTMKRASGLTLDQILKGLSDGEPSFCARYNVPVRLGIFRQVCQGVEYAHARGIIHRDLKPANVMVGDLGETYLLDWGIAKVVKGATGRAGAFVDSTSASSVGTPGYMAPEQVIDSDAVDARADIYALGAILFEILTLEPLHQGNNIAELIEATRLGRIEARMNIHRPELAIAPELERVCLLATQTDPKRRLGSVSELLSVIGDYLDGDRDLALRKSLAQPHAEAASASLRELLANGDPDDRLRAQALREAGHALALDPQSKTAIEVITRLMATAPNTMPDEAAAIMGQQERGRERVASRSGLWSHLLYIPPVALLLSIVHIDNWLAIAAMVGPLAFSTGIAMLRASDSKLRPSAMLHACALLCTASATSTILGPYLLVPGLLAGLIAVMTSYSKAPLEKPFRWAVMCLFAVVLPIVLQAANLLPVGFEFNEAGRIVIEHRISDASPTIILATLILSTLMSVFIPMAFAYRTGQQVRDMRDKLLIHMWHLRQLTPT